MPSIVSRETRLAKLERYYDDVYRDLAYQLRDVETGRLGAVHGGRWHVREARFLAPWEVRHQELSATSEEEFARAALKIERRDVHELQLDICEDVSTPVLLGIGSRRGGKSRGISFKVPISAVRRPHLGLEVIGPTHDKLQIMWRYVLAALPPHWIAASRADEHWIELVTGQRIKFISAHKPDSVIGEGVGSILFDELQSVKEAAWSLALPAASDGGRDFQITGVGTPRMGEFRQRYERIRALEQQFDARGRRKARIVHFTYRDNAFLETGDGTIFDLSQGLIDPRKRQQELDAEFVSEEGLVYYRFDRAIHNRSQNDMARVRARDVTANWLAEKAGSSLSGVKYLLGCDYGINRNFVVVYKVVNVGGSVGLWAVAECYGDRDYDLDALAEEVVSRGFYPAVVCDDASGPKSDGGKRAGWHWEDLRVRKGQLVSTGGERVFEVRHYSTNPARADRVDAVNALMGNSLGHVRWWVDVDSCSRLVECLENQELENGLPRRSKKGEISYHDMPDAAGYPCIYLFPAAVPYEREERLREAA